MYVCDDHTVAVEEREGEQQPEVSADETSSTEKQEQTSDESDMQTQTREEHSKLKSLINTTISEKLEQIQVHTQRHYDTILANI